MKLAWVVVATLLVVLVRSEEGASKVDAEVTVGRVRNLVQRNFEDYLEMTLSPDDFRAIKAKKFAPSSFKILSRAEIESAMEMAPKSLKGYLENLSRRHAERFSPEPGNRRVLNARLGTRQAPYRLKSRKQVADVKKALYTSDVSHTNPFENPYLAPGGPNDGVNRRIGAYVPPPDVTDPARFRATCDPLVSTNCLLMRPQPGSRHFRGAADPDSIAKAPRANSRLPALRTSGAGAPDPYTMPRAAAARALATMRSRSLSRLTLDPRDPRNFLPVDNRFGPKLVHQAPMRDPLPTLPSADVRTPKRRSLATARELELDPYARAQLIVGNLYARKNPPPPPEESMEHATGGGPADPVRHGQLRPQPAKVMSRRARHRVEAEPDTFIRSPRSDPVFKGYQPPVSNVQTMRDPMALPADGSEPQPVYMQFPRSIDEAGSSTHGAFPVAPLSYEQTNVPPPPNDNVPLSVIPWAPTPLPPAGPAGSVTDIKLPTAEKAFMFDPPTVQDSSPYQTAERRESSRQVARAVAAGN